jgi:hypothetical protein
MSEVERLAEDLRSWRHPGYDMPVAMIGEARRQAVAKELGEDPAGDIYVNGVRIVGIAPTEPTPGEGLCQTKDCDRSPSGPSRRPL